MSSSDRSAHVTKPRIRRMAREPGPCSLPIAPLPRSPCKLDQMESLLHRPNGASIAELMAATGWQQHSVRGAIAGALKKRGLNITSAKNDGVRRYTAGRKA